jgi:hypothetical protein
MCRPTHPFMVFSFVEVPKKYPNGSKRSQDSNETLFYRLCYLPFVIALKARWLSLFLSFEDLEEVKNRRQ